MNKGQKYTKAFDRIKARIDDPSAFDIIDELVRKEKPKKPIILGSGHMYHFECPVCHERGQYDSPKPRCMYCGQVFNWEK